jgi:hypothetical protein
LGGLSSTKLDGELKNTFESPFVFFKDNSEFKNSKLKNKSEFKNSKLKNKSEFKNSKLKNKSEFKNSKLKNKFDNLELINSDLIREYIKGELEFHNNFNYLSKIATINDNNFNNLESTYPKISTNEEIIADYFAKFENSKGNSNMKSKPTKIGSTSIPRTKLYQEAEQEFIENFLNNPKFAKQRKGSKAYDKSVEVIIAMKTGRLAKIIDIEKAAKLYEKEKYKFDDEIYPSEEEIRNKLRLPMDKEDRLELYNSLGKLFEPGYYPVDKSVLKNRRSLASLADNRFSDRSWLLEVILLGPQKIKPKHEKNILEEMTSDEKRIMTAVANAVGIGVVWSDDIIREYLKVIRKTEKVWESDTLPRLEGRVHTTPYLDNFAVFMEELIRFISRTVPNFREKFSPGWLHYKSRSYLLFCQWLHKYSKVDENYFLTEEEYQDKIKREYEEWIEQCERKRAY